MRHFSTLTAILLLSAAGDILAQEQVHLNQVGFYPEGPKVAIVVDADATAFEIISEDGGVVYSGRLGPGEAWDLSGETVRVADFTSFAIPGVYTLRTDEGDTSHPFAISEAVHREVARAALKGYYFQRASTALDARHAGVWARPAGHPDLTVEIHPSAASPGRPAGTTFPSPKGWYDAGDYGKYIVNSGISTYTLLAFFEHYPGFAAELETNIPESGDAVPDILDEALWNLRWMLTMQDPADGGVYHKLTTSEFSGYIMPHDGEETRYVVQKATGATLDFAAVMAQASRIFESFPVAFPGLADSMRTAALSAWNWARANPEQRYNQFRMNQQHVPDVVTGGYGDRSFADEFAWAATELSITARADSFMTVASPLDTEPAVPTWNSVNTLGWISAMHHAKALPAVDGDAARARFAEFARELAARRHAVPYRTVMGSEARQFNWGSSSNAANQGLLLLQAYRESGDADLLDAAISNLDYLLGRNATGFSLLTGVGARTPMHIHHRQSEADGIAEPVPGLLSGGPNAGQQDRCEYPSDLPAKSFVDDVCSYASNEIAINWNAPMVYLAAAIEAEMARRPNP